ncbi:MAG: hypothetical protein AAFZ15_04665 [Bacteroidota bacterium]
MTETIMSHTLEVCLWLLVAFLLGLLLGYLLWYQYRRLHGELQREHERLSSQHRELEAEHSSLKYKYEELEKDFNKRRTRVSALEGDVTVLTNKLKACEESKGSGDGNEPSSRGMATAAAGAMGAAAVVTTEKDDLKKIEGIGPKIEELCNNIGIHTWRQLADTAVETLQKMLDDAGPRYRISKPDTWPTQAGMAANGEWDKLKEYQDFLDGGVEPS